MTTSTGTPIHATSPATALVAPAGPRRALRAADRRRLWRAGAAARAVEEARGERAPTDRLVGAYHAARLAAAAVLAGAPPRRGPRDVWTRLGAQSEALASWAPLWAGYSQLVADLEVGLERPVGEQMADDVLFAAETFVAVAEHELGVGAPVAA